MSPSWWISWGSRLGLQVFPRECTVYSCGVLVDFQQILQFQQFVVGLCWTCNLFSGLRQCIKVARSPFWGCAIYSCIFRYFLVWLGLQGEWSIYSRNVLIFLFYCRCFHFCTAPFGGCAMYSQVLGIGWVYRCSHGNRASIPGVFWCRSSSFCISLHLYIPNPL